MGQIVCFQISCGGKFNNPGHMSYNPHIESVYDCIKQDGMIISKDDNGNPLPDDEWQYIDDGGNVILQGRDDIESDTGVVDYDGNNNKYIIKELEDCTDEEIDCLYDVYVNDGYIYNKDEVCDYIVERKGMHRIHDIRFYQCNAHISTSNGGWSFFWDGYDNNNDVIVAWQSWFIGHDIDPVSQEKWLPKCDITYFN